MLGPCFSGFLFLGYTDSTWFPGKQLFSCWNGSSERRCPGWALQPGPACTLCPPWPLFQAVGNPEPVGSLPNRSVASWLRLVVSCCPVPSLGALPCSPMLFGGASQDLSHPAGWSPALLWLGLCSPPGRSESKTLPLPRLLTACGALPSHCTLTMTLHPQVAQNHSILP